MLRDPGEEVVGVLFDGEPEADCLPRKCGNRPARRTEARAEIESTENTRPREQRDVRLARRLIGHRAVHVCDGAAGLDGSVQFDGIAEDVPPGLEPTGRGEAEDIPQRILPQVSRERGVQFRPGVPEVGQRVLEGSLGGRLEIEEGIAKGCLRQAEKACRGSEVAQERVRRPHLHDGAAQIGAKHLRLGPVSPPHADDLRREIIHHAVTARKTNPPGSWLIGADVPSNAHQ